MVLLKSDLDNLILDKEYKLVKGQYEYEFVLPSKVIEEGDFVTIDYGCFYEGYVSDITRTYAVGKLPDDKLVEIYNIVLEAQLLGIKAVKPGIKIKEVDKNRIERIYIRLPEEILETKEDK